MNKQWMWWMFILFNAALTTGQIAALWEAQAATSRDTDEVVSALHAVARAIDQKECK